MRNCNQPLCMQLSSMLSTLKCSSPASRIGWGGGEVWRPGIGSSIAEVSLTTGKQDVADSWIWGVIGGMHANPLGVPLCKNPVVHVLTSSKGEWCVYHYHPDTPCLLVQRWMQAHNISFSSIPCPLWISPGLISLQKVTLPFTP